MTGVQTCALPISTGIQDLAQNKSLPVVINIHNEELMIQLPESLLHSTLNLYDINGRLINTKKSDTNICKFNVSQLPTGLYLVRISKLHFIHTQKIIIP